MKKSLPVARLLAISAIVLSGLALAGCFGGSGGGSSSNAAAPVATPPVAAASPIADSGLIQSVRPISDSLSVDTNKKLAVTFNQDMDGDSISGTSFLLQGETGPAIVGDVTYDATSRTAIFKPDSPGLTDDTLYTATLTTDVETAGGMALEEDLSWQFTTGSSTDTVRPTATFSTQDGAVDVPVNRDINAVFSESVDPTTVSATSFLLQTGGAAVPGSVSYTGSTAVFNPAADLLPNTLYTATLTTAIIDLANPANALLADQSVNFTTGALVASAQGPAPVPLGTAGNFVILSKTGITTTGVTAITGDIGVSPISEAAITGFGQTRDATNEFSKSDLVSGKIFAANMAAPTPTKLTTAISDMELAFNNAAGRSNPTATEVGAGDISGLTFTPGLYKWGTGVSASSDFTFNGGANDVWVMQISQDLLLRSDVAVQLAGGAKAENIFWQVSGQATLRTGATLKGIVLSKTQIVMETGATFNGRALAQTLVTLDAVTATQP